MSAKIIFVYNADTGLFNSLSDWVHKVVSPSTYSCNLCVLTHHNFGAREEWKEFIKQISLPMEFLHKDEFVRKYSDSTSFSFPCILRNDLGTNKLIVSSIELNSYTELAQLKEKIRDVL